MRYIERYKGNEIITEIGVDRHVVFINGVDIKLSQMPNDESLYTSPLTFNYYPSPIDLARGMIDTEFALKGTTLDFITSRLIIRRNIALLDYEEKIRFRNAVYQIKEEGQYDTFVKVHRYAGNLGHFGPAFLPWHRVFCYKFEQELQRIDPEVTLPYWDSTSENLDAKSNSRIWRTELFGKNGEVNFSWKGQNRKPYTWTVRRNTFNLIQAPIDRRSFNLERDHYNDFRPEIEGKLSGVTHVFLGAPDGDQTSFATAVNDPFYFLIHANIDRLWMEWQLRMKKKWLAENPDLDYPASELANDYYWDAGDIDRTWLTPPNRHNLDSVMWPWDGTTIPGGGPETAISPWKDGMTEIFTPRMMLNHHDWGYAYDTEPKSSD